MIGTFLLTTWLIDNVSGTERSIRIRLSEQAIRDGLTGLYNHRYFHEMLETKIENAQENGLNLGLIMIDLDFFKYYNDIYGHLAGDRYLQDISIILRNAIEPADTAFRYGGDEFMVIVENPSVNKTLQVAQRIRQSIDAHTLNLPHPQWQYKPTASVGLALYPLHATDKNDLLQKVDDALYRAKAGNRNKVEVYYSVLDQLKLNLEDSEENLFETIKTLLTIINIKDQYTYGHSERVLIFTTLLAGSLGLPYPEIKALQYSAYLHDIGKIEIGREILNKTGQLTKEEKEIISQHPYWGSVLIKPIKALASSHPHILHHHERYDGKGYPAGLAGKEIPLGARILCIADAFDAMTTDRPYRVKMTIKKALAELKLQSNKQFDPELVEAFCAIIEPFKNIESLLEKGKEKLKTTLL